MNFWQYSIFWFVQLAELFVFVYGFLVMLSYVLLTFLSAKVVRDYQKKTSLVQYDELLSSPFAPSISIIAPAYNESLTIVDNIRSLLSIRYTDYDLIVVNDGSKDDTLAKAVAAYDLYLTDETYASTINTQAVRGIYRSRNPAYHRLLVIDKQNGGKADAINVGINISKNDYFACIDVDCILEPDVFLKMMYLVLTSSKRVVAVGGIVWLTNESVVRDGKIVKIVAPKSLIARFQVIEYIRAFLVGRPGWASQNALLLISGAMGLFERKVVLEIGGYNHNTVGEDMDIVMRIHGKMLEEKIDYEIAYIPEPLCWTEAPSDYTILGRQRNRWTRGTIDCLKMHRHFAFNRKYGIIGLLSYPYWFFAEWLSPLIEFFGLLFFAFLLALGLVNWYFFGLLLAFVYSFSILFSILALAVQEFTFVRYQSKRDVMRLVVAIFLEPFMYHPRNVWWALRGNYDYFIKKSVKWGEMTRTGFKKN